VPCRSLHAARIARRTALTDCQPGVGGGILAAEALSDLFSGDGLFGGDRNDYGDREYDQGYYDGRQDEERQGEDRQGDGGQSDGDGGTTTVADSTTEVGNTRPVQAIERTWLPEYVPAPGRLPIRHVLE
jgi:hypothetical protein